MRAIRLKNGMIDFREDVARPELGGGEALVRVRMAGICATDLELCRGYGAFEGIPGHEFIGHIVEAPGDPRRIGERVVGEINASCGRCGDCLSGRPRHCDRRTVLGIQGRDGAFADYLALPLENLISLPEGVSDDAAVFTEPLAAALEIQEQIEIGPDEEVLILGAGRLGQLVARALQNSGCKVSACARYPRQRDLLISRGITVMPESDIPHRRFDRVVEATGNPGGFDLARKAVRPGGTIVLKSTYHGDLRIDISSVVVDEITLIGSRCGPFPEAISLLEKGVLTPTDLIDARFPLEEFGAAFEQAGIPGALKVLFQIS